MKLASRIIPTEHRRIASRDEISFECPTPPSVNKLFFNRNTGGRGKTEAYRAWIKEAGWMIAPLRLGHIDGPVSIKIALSNSAKIDTDNACKSLVDICVRHGLIPDDNNKIVRSLTLDFADIAGAKVTIRRVTA